MRAASSVFCTYVWLLRRVSLGRVERQRGQDFAAWHLVVPDGLVSMSLCHNIRQGAQEVEDLLRPRLRFEWQ